MTRRPKSSARASKDRYLTPVLHGDGNLVGWRFTPGQRQRAMGARPQMLKDASGAWLSHKDARALRDRLLAALTHASRSPASDTVAPRPEASGAGRTLAALGQMHLAALQQSGAREARSSDTVRYYATYLKPWLELFGSDAPVAEITKQDLIEAIDIWALEGVSVSVRAARYRAMQAVLAFAERRGWIPDSPARRLKISKADPRRRRASDQEIALLVATADRLAEETGNPDFSHIGTAVVAAVWTGQRQGDLLACVLDRQLTTAQPGNPARLLFTQSKRGARVGPPLMLPLATRLAGRTTGPLIPFQGGGGPDPLPLASARGWAPDHFRHRFATVRAAASISDLTFQDLRDTAITRMYEAGATALQIASWSGHSLKTVHQILEHYIEHQNSVADEVGARLTSWAKARGISV